MWNRSELKEKAKAALKQNYWRVVLVTLIIFMIGGASGIDFSSSSGSSDSGGSSSDSFMEEFEQGFDYGYGMDEAWDEFTDDSFDYETEYDTGLEGDLDAILGEMGLTTNDVFAFAGIFLIVIVVVVILVAIVAILISTFIFSPLEVGARRFYFKNLNQPAEVKEVAYAFDNSYKNVVKILFFRNLYIFLWSLLFIIPGIVKSFEYMMIPYLLAENPSLSMEQAFALSKQMMTGNKWNAFVLHLSFIGWDILSSITLGIVGIFYVEPYRNQTDAALYEELSLIHGHPAFAAQGYAEYHYEQPQAETNENVYTSPEQEEI